MTKITIDYEEGMTVRYKVSDTIADAVESILSIYPHTVLEYAKEQNNENNS